MALTVTDSDRRDYVLIADGGEVRIEEREAPDADARVSGAQRSWIEAFAPDGSLEASRSRATAAWPRPCSASCATKRPAALPPRRSYLL